MRIHVLFGQRKEDYDGQYAPEALLAWDEYSREDNYDGFEEAVENEKKTVGDQMTAMRVIDLEVDGDKIRRLLIGTPVVKATIKTDE